MSNTAFVTRYLNIVIYRGLRKNSLLARNQNSNGVIHTFIPLKTQANVLPTYQRAPSIHIFLSFYTYTSSHALYYLRLGHLITNWKYAFKNHVDT